MKWIFFLHNHRQLKILDYDYGVQIETKSCRVWSRRRISLQRFSFYNVNKSQLKRQQLHTTLSDHHSRLGQFLLYNKTPQHVTHITINIILSRYFANRLKVVFFKYSHNLITGSTFANKDHTEIVFVDFILFLAPIFFVAWGMVWFLVNKSELIGIKLIPN